jgi:hypothetical protein
MGLLYCWLRIVAGLFTEPFPSNGSTCHYIFIYIYLYIYRERAVKLLLRMVEKITHIMRHLAMGWFTLLVSCQGC